MNTTNDLQTVSTVHPTVVKTRRMYAQKKTIFRFYQIIWYVLGIIEVLLGFRVVLKAIGANAGSEFVSFIYAVSNPFAIPFLGIIRTSISGVYVVEWSTLIAMVVY